MPLGDPTLVTATSSDSPDAPNRRPMEADTIRRLEELASDMDVTPLKRLFCATSALMTYARIMSSDEHRIKDFDANADPARVTLTVDKARMQKGLQRPRAGPIDGITGSSDRIQLVFDYRATYIKKNGTYHSRCAPRINRAWELGASGAASYASTHRMLYILRFAPVNANGEKYTMRPPTNFFDTAATLLNFTGRR